MSSPPDKGTDEQTRRLVELGWMYASSGGWMGPTQDGKFDGVFYTVAEAIAIVKGLAKRREPPITYKARQR